VIWLFKENNGHLQSKIFGSTDWMIPGIKAKLEKSWASIFYKQVFCNIDEQPFAVLYSDTGRPNFPVNILLALEFIKHLESFSDEKLFENFYFNYLIAYAVGIRTLGEVNLAPRTFYDFRARVYQHLSEHPEQEDLIFGQFLNLLNKFTHTLGVSAEQQRMDTTMFMSNIKKSGRLSLAYDVLSQAVKTIPNNLLTEDLKQVLEPKFKTETLYKSKASEAENRLDLLLNLCQEACKIMKTIPEFKGAAPLRIAIRFIAEQAETDAETGRLKAKDKKTISTKSLQSAYDEDATFRRKNNVAQSGYVCEIAETCDRNNPVQLITDYTVKPNATSDVEIHQERAPKLKDTGCKELYQDGGFYHPEAQKDPELRIHYTDMTGSEPTPKKLPVTAFEIDPATKLINKCPNNIAPFHSGVTKGQTVAHFKLEDCSNCKLCNQCPAKVQKKDAVVRINLNSVKAAETRAEIKEEHKENTSMRAAIEGTNSVLKRSQGLGKLRVRSKVKCQIVVGFKVIAQNIKRVCNVLLGKLPKPTKPNQGIPMPI
jgi:hypothetical protein